MDAARLVVAFGLWLIKIACKSEGCPLEQGMDSVDMSIVAGATQVLKNEFAPDSTPDQRR